jgi:uncharacterized protein
MISWEYFHPEREIPDLFRYIQDRYLWHWKLEGTGEIAAGLQLLPQEFDLWIDLLTPEGLKQYWHINRFEGSFSSYHYLTQLSRSYFRWV